MPRESASRSTTALSPRSGSTPSASSHGESQRDSWKPVSRNTPTASSSSGSVVPPTITSISSGPYRPNEDHPPPQTAGSPAGSDACVAGPGAPPHPSSDGVVVAPPAPSHRPPGTPAFGPSAWSPSDRYSPLVSTGPAPAASIAASVATATVAAPEAALAWRRRRCQSRGHHIGVDVLLDGKTFRGQLFDRCLPAEIEAALAVDLDRLDHDLVPDVADLFHPLQA